MAPQPRDQRFVRVSVAGLVAVISLALTALGEDSPAKVNFSRDIQPLLARRCFVCHGPSDQKAGLALHTRTAATANADSGNRAIVPGQSAASHLLLRVLSTDQELRMPLEAPALSKQEIAVLRKWIDQGAVYSRHWAFVAPKRPAAPTKGDPGISPVDHFIGNRLRRAGLQPAPEAERHTLIRRLSIDLLGLLPSRKQIDHFLKDRSE
ncbi:MAG: c-type cytochrome domain-containing protein, partial [Planctomycetaceae bacterium]